MIQLTNLICDVLFKSCILCGSAWGDTNVFCTFCWKRLLVSPKRKVSFYPFQVNRLFIWNKDSDLYLKNLIYHLKEGRNQRTIEKLSEKLFHRYLDEDFRKEKGKKNIKANWVFLPSPPRIQGRKDHAWHLASFLSFHFKESFETPLQREKNSKPQKTKNFMQRRETSMNLIDSKWKPSSKKVYVFVDDIITTGETALAAYKALKKPKNFLVWAIAERPLWREKKE